MIPLIGIRSENVDKVWPDVKPYIERALDKSQGEYRAEDILKAIKDKDMQLWVGGNITYVGVTQILTYPSGKKVIDIVLTAGDELMSWLEDSNNTIYEWARQLDADQVRIMGRPGWSKMLHRIGFEHAYTVMIKGVQQ